MGSVRMDEGAEAAAARVATSSRRSLITHSPDPS